mmetsp:Transcript_47613/g.126187  ORF Transcript_47613/g.126187 Transcript_47613/m.126187 type:complete len:353 (-) Transcript_47613:50-1108(-)
MGSLAYDPKKSGCENCGKKSDPRLDHSSGDLVCTTCGLVLESQLLDDAAEWRDFASETAGGPSETNARARGDKWSGFKELLGEVGIDGTGMMGTVAGGQVSRDLLRAQQIAAKSGTGVVMAKGDRTLANHVGRLKDVVKQLNLSDSILGQCVGLLKSLQAASALPRACTESFLGAVVFLACREERLSRTMREIAVTLAPPSGPLGKGMIDFEKDVEKKVRVIQKSIASELRTMPAVSVPVDEVMPRFLSRLHLPSELQHTMEHVVNTVLRSSLINLKLQDSVFAAAIFMVACLLGRAKDLTMKDVAAAVKVTEAEAVGTFKKLRPQASRLLPPNFVSKLRGGLDSLPSFDDM